MQQRSDRPSAQDYFCFDDFFKKPRPDPTIRQLELFGGLHMRDFRSAKATVGWSKGKLSACPCILLHRICEIPDAEKEGAVMVVVFMRRIWFHILHTLLPLGALGLHVVIFAAYARRWDKMAALTVFPFWAWGLLGMGMAGFAWLLTKQRLALAVAGLWLATILIFSDETPMLLRSWKTQPEPGMPLAAADGSRVRRVISLNCKGGQWNPASVEEVVKWEPDVVLFQESADRSVLDQVARKLYGGQPGEHSEATWECGVITRGQIRRSVKSNLQGNLSVTIQFDDGTFLEVASVHLRGAETDVRLYTRETLYKHALNRKARRTELQKIVTMQTMVNGERPALIGGDFNAPAGDAIFRLLSGAGFRDAIVAAGSGWPNTYPNQAPMLRIDQQWVNSRCVPLRGRVVKTQNSDHRMVICDYLIQ